MPPPMDPFLLDPRVLAIVAVAELVIVVGLIVAIARKAATVRPSERNH